MDTNQSNHIHQDSPSEPLKARPGRGLLVAHIVNLLLIFILFTGTHYFLTANNCLPAIAFRWSLVTAAIYGVLSILLLSSWLRRKNK